MSVDPLHWLSCSCLFTHPCLSLLRNGAVGTSFTSCSNSVASSNRIVKFFEAYLVVHFFCTPFIRLRNYSYGIMGGTYK